MKAALLGVMMMASMPSPAGSFGSSKTKGKANKKKKSERNRTNGSRKKNRRSK